MAGKRLGFYNSYSDRKAYSSDLKRNKKIRAVEYKGGVCTKCLGVFDPCVYDFHHVDPETKLATACTFLNWGWPKLSLELDKCVLLCSNCHRLHHYKAC